MFKTSMSQRSAHEEAGACILLHAENLEGNSAPSKERKGCVELPRLIQGKRRDSKRATESAARLTTTTAAAAASAAHAEREEGHGAV